VAEAFGRLTNSLSIFVYSLDFSHHRRGCWGSWTGCIWLSPL